MNNKNTYYQRNKEIMLVQSKENSLESREKLKELAINKCSELSDREKDETRKHGINRHIEICLKKINKH